MSSEDKVPSLPPAYNEVVSSSKEYKCQHHDGKQHPRYPNRSLQTPEGVHFLGPEEGTCDQTDIPQITQPGSVPHVIKCVPHHDWTAAAIFACLCCFWPAGLAAIRYASKANSASNRGDEAATKQYSRKARNLIIISVILGIFQTAVVVVLRT
ncbi:uncharacterized protein LOC111101769 isoform X3 [Crassostrea virginica]